MPTGHPFHRFDLTLPIALVLLAGAPRAGAQVARVDVCGDVTVSAWRNRDGLTRLRGPVALSLPASISVAATPPGSIDLVELRYLSHPQGNEAVCNYARRGGPGRGRPGDYRLVFCSTGARARSVVTATELKLRILGWRRGAAARAVLERVGCQPNVPTLPPFASLPGGYRGIDSAGFLRARLPLVSSRVRARVPAPTDWEPIPAGPPPPGTTSALIDSTGLSAAHPLAAASLGKQAFVFAVGADGRVLHQALDAASLGWAPSWSEVPGGLVTDRRVAATATADTLFLFARDARTGSLLLNRRTLACAGGSSSGCWSGWGKEALPADYGPASFAAASDGSEVFLVTNGPYARPPSSRFAHALRVSTRRTTGAWSAFSTVTVAGAEPGLPTPIASDSWPTAASDGRTLDLRVYGSLRRLGGDPLSSALGPARVSRFPGATTAWRACALPTRILPAPLRNVTPAPSIVDGAEGLFALDAAGRVEARNASGDECPAWTAPAPLAGLTAVAAESPAVAAFETGGRTTRFLVAARDALGVARFQVLTSLRLHVLRVADGDGANRASVTPAQFAAWVAEANRVYAAARLWFVFARALDLEDRDDWALNATGQCDPMVTFSTGCIATAYANSVAALYPRRLLVLARFGNDVTDIDGQTRVATGGGWSWYDLDFAVMPGFPVTTICRGVNLQNIGLLAHELGHNLGLWHTFGADDDDEAFTPATARQRLQDLRNEYWLAFDADAPSGVADTVPDPSVDFTGLSGGVDEFCRPPAATISITTTWGTVTWTPPRMNAMSYYNPRDASGALLTHELSPDQVERVYANLPF